MIGSMAFLFAFVLGLPGAQGGTLALVYPDGTRLTIDTVSSGPTVHVPGSGSVESERDTWHRVLRDKQGKVLFAYDIEARRTGSGTFRILIAPVEPGFSQRLSPGDVRVPTVADVRDFSEVKTGESVKIDILYNPFDGDRIYDVLQPSVSTVWGGLVSQRPAEEEFSFGDMQITVKGSVYHFAHGGTITGAAARIHVPEHWPYYLALEQPPQDYKFQPAGRVDGEKLTFAIGVDPVEITSRKRLLTKSLYHTVWVYQDRQGGLETPSGQVEILTADDVLMLMGRSRRR
jgi:hypothetical protein